MKDVVTEAKAVLNRCMNDGDGCRCEARHSSECGCGGVEWASVHECEKIIRNLLSIVERLPVTADGVPITPGVEHFYNDHGKVRGGVMLGSHPTGWDEIAGRREWINHALCYSTRAAAEAAGGEA